ncbi:unnamed protein product [Gongylonema pulchrum]|uniref:SLH domain-containing protein n=1 Tax=Gongylonema pulchrum TaxID=637853 RepID=A0A183D628_9BILA|nr:unnamed protein product [Gongylonema pulchrum]
MPNQHGISMLPKLTTKSLSLSERALITDVLYGYPDPFLDRDFAPSNDYPIGFRFNRHGLERVLKAFGVTKLIRTCGARIPTGKYYDFDDSICFTFATGAPRAEETDRSKLLLHRSASILEYICFIQLCFARIYPEIMFYKDLS